LFEILGPDQCYINCKLGFNDSFESPRLCDVSNPPSTQNDHERVTE